MSTTEFDDLFLQRLDQFCKSLKQESSETIQEALAYKGEDEREIKVGMISMAQAKIEVRMRLEFLIRQAREVRKDLGGVD